MSVPTVLPEKPPAKEPKPSPPSELKVLPAKEVLKGMPIPPPPSEAGIGIQKIIAETQAPVKALSPEVVTVFGAPRPEQAPKEAKGYQAKPIRKFEPESPQLFDILEFDLGIARDGNEPIPIIWDRIYILKRDGTVYFKKSDTEKWLDLSMARLLDITPNSESKFFLKNTAQSGKGLVLAVGRLGSFWLEPAIGGAMLIMDTEYNFIDPAQLCKTPTIYNVTCTVANTEYSQALPANTKKFMIKARGGDLKVCFTSGQSGSIYLTVYQTGAYFEDLIKLASATLYFQSPTAGTVAEIIAWVS